MTTLLTIAELLAGEALVSPGGPVDRLTAAGDDDLIWPYCLDTADAVVAQTTVVVADEALVPA